MRFLFFLQNCFQSIAVSAQVNLVPNPSFEEDRYCPEQHHLVDSCVDWFNARNSPDYFNGCSTDSGALNNDLGFQYPHSGQAMVGIISYAYPSDLAHTNYREFVSAKLIDSLQIGTRYFVSMYVNFSGRLTAFAIATNKIGVNFSTVPFNSFNPPPLTNYSIICSTEYGFDNLSLLMISSKVCLFSTR